MANTAGEAAPAGGEGWKPTRGQLEIENLRLWYDPDDPGTETLKGVSLAWEAGSKVGVVGRTGAGKSSLITALLRLAPTSGTVKIDGVPGCM